MTFRFRIAAWVVASSALLICVMMFTGYRQIEEELREGRKDPTHPGSTEWKLHNSFAEAEIQEILSEMTRTWLWTAAPIIALSLGAGLLLARRSLRPVHDINRQLGEMLPNSLHGCITISEADPVIADLADHLNGLLDRAGSAYQEMAGFSARVAHELRTPLMLLRMRIENAPPGMPPAFQEDLQDELARLARFVERSLMAAKAEQGTLESNPVPLCLSDLIRDVAEDYGLLAAERGLSMEVNLADDLNIAADADLLRQALHGLLENAVRYAKSNIRVFSYAENGKAVLEIVNDRDEESMATPGLGLGLRLVRGICKASGAVFESLQVDSGFRARLLFDHVQRSNPRAYQIPGSKA